MNRRKTNLERIAVIYSRADECMDNRGKDMRGDRASDCSKPSQVEVGKASEISNMRRFRIPDRKTKEGKQV